MYVNMCFILIATQTPRSPLETATSSGKTERLTMWLQNTEAEELGAWPRWAKMGQDGPRWARTPMASICQEQELQSDSRHEQF